MPNDHKLRRVEHEVVTQLLWRLTAESSNSVHEWLLEEVDDLLVGFQRGPVLHDELVEHGHWGDPGTE